MTADTEEVQLPSPPSEAESEPLPVPEPPAAAAPAPRPEDRRASPRRPMQVKLMVAVGKEIFVGRTEDISTDGACLRLKTMLPAGLHIQIRFVTPFLKQFDHIDVRASTRYSSMTSGEPPCRIGVRFEDLSAEQRSHILALLQS